VPMATASGAIASTVFAAVNGGIGSSNTIINWVEKLESFSQQFGEAGETIRGIQVAASTRRADLQLWMNFWKIEATTKYPYQRELWGDTQLTEIRVKICTIEYLCSRFNEEFSKLFERENVSWSLQNTVERKGPVSISQLLATFCEDAKVNVKDASTSQITQLVRKLKPRAPEWLSGLKTMLSLRNTMRRSRTACLRSNWKR
jgi:hypothetical protein